MLFIRKAKVEKNSREVDNGVDLLGSAKFGAALQTNQSASRFLFFLSKLKLNNLKLDTD